MKLNFFHVGNGPNLIIIHGLFGSASNFRTLAKQFAESYSVYCVDLRNHGNSPHDDDISFDAMAADIMEFMQDHGLETASIMGHSLGGKVAMQLALTHPDVIEKLIIGDIAPVPYPHHHDRIFEGLNAIDNSQIESRKQAEKILSDYVDIPAVRLFLLTNLVRCEEKGFKWRINVSGLQHNYHLVSRTPVGDPYLGKTLFIRGDLSDYVKSEYYPAIHGMFPNAEIQTLEGTGHWLHAEKPVEYCKMVLEFLDKD